MGREAEPAPGRPAYGLGHHYRPLGRYGFAGHERRVSKGDVGVCARRRRKRPSRRGGARRRAWRATQATATSSCLRNIYIYKRRARLAGRWRPEPFSSYMLLAPPGTRTAIARN
eukprot:scaffold2986_cov30-Tisochrysis_lutea.AAC.1